MLQQRLVNVPTRRFEVTEHRFSAPAAASNLSESMSYWQGGGAITNVIARSHGATLAWLVEGKKVERTIVMFFCPEDIGQILRSIASYLEVT